MRGEADEITPAELRQRLEQDGAVLVLDLRAAGEFARWRIEAARPPATLHVPYTRIVAEADTDDLAEAAAAYARQHLARELSNERTIVVVCAKGGASAFVAAGLCKLGYAAVNLAGGMRAWGDDHEVRRAGVSEGVEVWQILRPARGCISHIVTSDGQALVVDPLRDTDFYRDWATKRGLRVAGVLDTHAHADHISGGRRLADEAGVPYWLHPYDAIHPLDLLPASFAFQPLYEGWSIEIGRSRIRALHVPGHTLGQVALLVEDHWLIAGDTIFLHSVSRPDLGGHSESWSLLHARSLRRLLELPDDVVVLPGHVGSPAESPAGIPVAAPLGELRSGNPALGWAVEGDASFAQHARAGLAAPPEAYMEIKRVNLGLITATDDRARELELGPNLCALAL